jgi:hypothetical protein
MTSKRKIAVFTQEKPDDCVICTEKMNENDPLNCGHWIHYTCIQKQFKAECPVCRAPLDIKVKGSRPSDESLNILRVVGDVVERWFDGNDVEGNEVEGNEVEGNDVEDNEVEDNEVEGNAVEENPDRPLTRVQEVLLYRYGFVPRMLFRGVRNEVTDHEVTDHEVEDHEVTDHEVEDGPVNEEDYDEENPSGDSVYYD